MCWCSILCRSVVDVMPPDEWHYPVNNSIYTNYVAKMALQLPRALCDVISCHAPASYENVADKIYLLFDAVNQYHPEYDTYTLSKCANQKRCPAAQWICGRLSKINFSYFLNLYVLKILHITCVI